MRVVPDQKVVHPSQVQFGRTLTDVPVGSDLPSPEEIQDELLYYCDVLLGRIPPPIDNVYLTQQEVATAYLARAAELEMKILWEEQNHRVIRGHILNRMRTGQIRTFIEMAKKVADAGSRRLTQEVLLNDQRYDSGDRG